MSARLSAVVLAACACFVAASCVTAAPCSPSDVTMIAHAAECRARVQAECANVPDAECPAIKDCDAWGEARCGFAPSAGEAGAP